MKQAVEFEECLKDSPRFRWETEESDVNEHSVSRRGASFHIFDCSDSLWQGTVLRYARHLTRDSYFTSFHSSVLDILDKTP